MTTECSGRAVERRQRLDPVPESARVARRTVLTTLEAAGRADLAEAAGLLVSELVTNAIVHARTPIDLDVVAGRDGLRVAVSDNSPHLPTPRHYGRSATTGRGLALVELLADRHGTENGAVDGKTVWFELGAVTAEADAVDAVAVDAAADGAELASALDGDLVVHLRGLPVGLALAWQQHADTLLREHLLTRWESPPGAGPYSADGAAAGDAFAVLAAALEHLRPASSLPPYVDVSMSLPRAAVRQFDALDALLDHVLGLSEQGLTLAPPTQPEIRLLRRWICEEVRSQADGLAPEPWPGLPPELSPAAVPPIEWDPSGVRSAAEALVAADDVNRILAASPAALGLLGWDEDLVGCRISTVIPARLREAHVAAFTLHLLTGESTILDHPVSVPALRRDGTEVMVSLLVRREVLGDGRIVFIARLGTP